MGGSQWIAAELVHEDLSVSLMDGADDAESGSGRGRGIHLLADRIAGCICGVAGVVAVHLHDLQKQKNIVTIHSRSIDHVFQ